MPKKKRFDSQSNAADKPTKKYHDGVAPGAADSKPVLWTRNPQATVVRFPQNPSAVRSYDLGPWYDGRIDALTRACHQAIDRMLEEGTLTTVTVVDNCRQGLGSFLPFCQLWSTALDAPMELSDVTKELIESYLLDLRGQEYSYTTQRNRYKRAKSVLKALARHGWIDVDDLFPRNPFPHGNRMTTGEKPLSTAERHRAVTRLKADLATIQDGDGPLNSDELAVCMLGIAVRSGINPVPLVELSTNCIQPHPIKHDRKLLVSHKRRGGNTHIQPLRKSSDVALLKTVMLDVDTVVELVRRRNAGVRAKSGQYNDRLFVYESRDPGTYGEVGGFNRDMLGKRISHWVKRHGLLDDSGKPLRLNTMRLRKTFENRIWMLSGRDLIVTAKLGGHSLKVSSDHYLAAPPEAEKQFRLMGEVLTRELLEDPKVTALPAENTPVSKCRDSLNGQFAPHRNGEHCTNFLACVRCRSFVVTQDDLWRLYSFYWLLVHEREHIGSRKWSRYYGHIIRIIDREIAPRFAPEVVEAARRKARENPHPFWLHRDQLEDAV
jgi:integrase